MNDSAQTAFISSIEESRQLLQKLQERLGNFLGVDPDRVNWANVGDAKRLKSQLEQIVRNE